MIVGMILLFIGVIIFCMILHEFLHYATARILDYPSKIGIDRKGLFTTYPDWVKTSDEKKILRNGVFFGALPLLLLLPNPLLFGAGLIFYYAGSERDLKRLTRLKKCMKVK